MLRSARASRKTLTDVVQQELRQAILSGAYQPGSQLPTEAEIGDPNRAALKREARKRAGAQNIVLQNESLLGFCRAPRADKYRANRD